MLSRLVIYNSSFTFWWRMVSNNTPTAAPYLLALALAFSLCLVHSRTHSPFVFVRSHFGSFSSASSIDLCYSAFPPTWTSTSNHPSIHLGTTHDATTSPLVFEHRNSSDRIPRTLVAQVSRIGREACRESNVELP